MSQSSSREADLKTPLTESHAGHRSPDNKRVDEEFDGKDDFGVVNDDFFAADTEQERIQKMCFCRRVWNKYDKNFLIVYGIQYANLGLKFL